MRHRLAVVAVPAVLTALVLTLDAQRAESPSQATFRSRTDLVPVDVSVLDKDRRPVRGLASADFTLVVDGKARPIVAFSEVDVPGVDRQVASAPWLRDAPHDVVSNDLPEEGRLVAILMDATTPNGAATIAAKQIAHAAIDQLGPGDLAAVVRDSVFSNNGRSQGFTNDRARLIQAIDSPFMGTTEPPTMRANGLVSASPIPMSTFQTQRHCEVILNVVRAMRDAPRRRKTLIFVGSVLHTGGTITSDGEDRPCKDVMLQELDGSNVTVHVVDPVGLLTGAPTADYVGPMSPGLVHGWAEQNRARIDALRRLPGRTGGRAVVNTNTPEGHLPAIFAESQAYYLLGFDASSLSADKLTHAIRVDVKRRGVTVHSRAEFAAPAAAAAPPVTSAGSRVATAPPPDLAAALDGPLPVQRLPLSVTVAPFATSDRRTAAVAIALGATLSPGTGPRRLSVTVGAFDIRGRAVAVRSQVLEVSSELAPQGHVTDGLVARLDLPAGSYELRVAAKDAASGAIGSVFSFVDVPEFSNAPLMASGLVLHRDPAPRIADNPLASLVPVVPTVMRVLRPGQKVSAFLRVYHDDDTRAMSVTARVVDANNRTVFVRPVDLGGDGTKGRPIDVDVPLPLGELVPGQYLLTITIARGPTQVERSVRFEMKAKP